MNYPEELRERYNEVMYDERDIIEKFLKDQYDIRYGRQRDTWHFEPAVEMMNIYGNEIVVTDIRLDKDKFVVFDGMFGKLKDEYECSDFAYSELSKVIEALPNAEDIVWDNAVNDLKVMTTNLRIDYLLNESPFKYEVGSKNYVVDDVKCVNGKLSLVQALGNDTPVSDLPLEVLVGLRDHINIEHLHRTKEYKEVMKCLSLEPSLRKEVDVDSNTKYGAVIFTLANTDIECEVSSIQRDGNGNLTIFGFDKDCIDDTFILKEEDIKKEYLEVILKWLTTRSNIIDTYNAHNPELVRKINAAWRDDKYHDKFEGILHALLERDYEEYCDKFEVPEVTTSDYAMNHAHEIMEGVCDDQDLETILSFIRYEE